MAQKTLQIVPQTVTKELLIELEVQGLLRPFRPTAATAQPPEGETVVESLYESDPALGPHKLIAVGVHKTEVRLGVHPGNEEFLIPDYSSEVKPLYLLIAHLPVEELRAKDQNGSLSESDFTCLSLYPSPRGAEMFTMPQGVVHCESTVPGPGRVGSFFVTESRDLTVDWIDLEFTRLQIA